VGKEVGTLMLSSNTCECG